MALEYTYKVSGVKVYSEEDKADIIKEATLHIIATEDGESYESFLPIQLAEPSGSFTQFQNVSEEQVLEWLKGTLGEEQLNANKEGLKSCFGNPMFSSTPTRDNPQEKELLS